MNKIDRRLMNIGLVKLYDTMKERDSNQCTITFVIDNKKVTFVIDNKKVTFEVTMKEGEQK